MTAAIASAAVTSASVPSIAPTVMTAIASMITAAKEWRSMETRDGGTVRNDNGNIAKYAENYCGDQYDQPYCDRIPFVKVRAGYDNPGKQAKSGTPNEAVGLILLHDLPSIFVGLNWIG